MIKSAPGDAELAVALVALLLPLPASLLPTLRRRRRRRCAIILGFCILAGGPLFDDGQIVCSDEVIEQPTVELLRTVDSIDVGLGGGDDMRLWLCGMLRLSQQSAQCKACPTPPCLQVQRCMSTVSLIPRKLFTRFRGFYWAPNLGWARGRPRIGEKLPP